MKIEPRNKTRTGSSFGVQATPVQRTERQFVGRSSEIAAFDARIDDASRADGSVTLLFGEAGIGKSSLLRKWLERARARSFSVASVSNFPFAHDPYAPIAELCRTLARSDPRAVPRGENRALFTRFLDLLPLGNDPEAEPWQKRRLFVLVREFLERVASSSPLVLAIDDAHWIDPESLELMQYLAPYFSDLRAVLVLALRKATSEITAQSLASIERQPSCYRVALGPLSAPETRELIYSFLPLGQRLAQRTIDDICGRCEESPLFAEELVHSALQDGSTPSLPQTVEQSVNDRLARLGRDDAALLEIASVIGPRIDLEMLRSLVDVSARDEMRVLRAARDMDLVADGDTVSGGLHFRHEFIREAIYARLTSVERRAHHQRIAAYLQARVPPASPGELHRHVHGAGETVAAAAIAIRAGDEAMARFAFATARYFYDSALADSVLGPAETARVAEKLGEAHDLLGSHREAAACFARADAYARDVEDRERQAAIAIRLAIAAGRLSDHKAERRHCERALACSGQIGRHAFAAEVLLTLHHANRVDAEGAAGHLQRADALITDDDRSFGVRHHVARAALANLRGDVAAWRTASFDAVAAAEACGDPAMLANVWSYVADFARLMGDSELAGRGFADAIAAADHFGLTFTAAKTRLAAADMAYGQGRVADAHRFVREASALQVDGAYARMHVSAVGLPIALAAEDAFLSERLDDVELIESLQNFDAQPLAISFFAAHAELRARQGDLRRARLLIERALPRVRHAAFVDSALLVFARYGSAAHAQEAARLLESTADRNDPIACVHIPLVASFAAAAGANPVAARGLAREARSRAQTAGTPLLEALALELEGDTAAAVRLYAACGSLGDVRRLSDGRGVSSGPTASDLTRRASEVATLIAEGLSNRVIAERLVVSERTVEHHVAAIFGKLGFRSRAQLAAFMSRATS